MGPQTGRAFGLRSDEQDAAEHEQHPERSTHAQRIVEGEDAHHPSDEHLEVEEGSGELVADARPAPGVEGEREAASR